VLQPYATIVGGKDMQQALDLLLTRLSAWYCSWLRQRGERHAWPRAGARTRSAVRLALGASSGRVSGISPERLLLSL